MAPNVMAWTIPATGELPPWRIFVAVRAIAPVDAIPPNNGANILANPCPNNSVLDSCLVPLIPSATTADNKDSIAPSMAIVKAGPIKDKILSKLNFGTENSGKPWGIPPNALPIVKTVGNW